MGNIQEYLLGVSSYLSSALQYWYIVLPLSGSDVRLQGHAKTHHGVIGIRRRFFYAISIHQFV